MQLLKHILIQQFSSNGKPAGETIIAVKANEKTLHTIIKIAERKGIQLRNSTSDAGKTEVAPDTITVGYVGPDTDEKIDKLIGQLKLL